MSIEGLDKACGCLSGITDRQAVLIELGGMLEMVAWKVHEAHTAFVVQATPSDQEAAEYLRKVEIGLENLKKWTTENAWRPK